jgi:hypothetical protein
VRFGFSQFGNHVSVEQVPLHSNFTGSRRFN